MHHVGQGAGQPFRDGVGLHWLAGRDQIACLLGEEVENPRERLVLEPFGRCDYDWGASSR